MYTKVKYMAGAFAFLLSAGLQAATVWVACDIANVAVLPGSLVHVMCTQPSSGAIVYFALPARNAAEIAVANQYQALATAALTMNKKITIGFDDADTSGVAYGCVTANCRRPFSVYVSK